MRILIVEDEEAVSDFLKKGLESEGYVVDLEVNGLAGSFAARTNDYDAVILDNLLPEKNGSEVCKEIRSSGKTVPILMLSVQTQTNYKVELLNFGADDYLSKPFSFEELLARLRALLRRSGVKKEQNYILGDLVLNSRNQTAVRGGADIYLSRKEYMLLEYLMLNKGYVVSRAMILEHVWDMSADPFSNTIESHMVSLRKKIELDTNKKLIKTIPGRGYKIDL